MEVLKKLTEVPGRYTNAVPVPYPHPIIFTRAYPYPGYCATGILNLKKLRYGYYPGKYLGYGSARTLQNTTAQTCYQVYRIET